MAHKQFNLNNVELDTIINEWLLEWKVWFSDKDLSDMENGPPPEIPIKKYNLKDTEEESQE